MKAAAPIPTELLSGFFCAGKRGPKSGVGADWQIGKKSAGEFFARARAAYMKPSCPHTEAAPAAILVSVPHFCQCLFSVSYNRRSFPRLVLNSTRSGSVIGGRETHTFVEDVRNRVRLPVQIATDNHRPY